MQRSVHWKIPWVNTNYWAFWCKAVILLCRLFSSLAEQRRFLPTFVEVINAKNIFLSFPSFLFHSTHIFVHWMVHRGVHYIKLVCVFLGRGKQTDQISSQWSSFLSLLKMRWMGLMFHPEAPRKEWTGKTVVMEAEIRYKGLSHSMLIFCLVLDPNCMFPWKYLCTYWKKKSCRCLLSSYLLSSLAPSSYQVSI